MNSRHAEYIMTILKEGSFTAAAKKLYLSQPSLSQIVKSAEHSLGMPIFDRTTVPLTLTPAGELYIRAAQQIAQITENLDREIQELQEKKRGCIHIGIPIQRAAKIVPYLYGAFSREYPQVQLDFHECGSGDLEKSILENSIDFAFLATTPQNPALTYELIKEERVVLLANKECEIAKRFAFGTPVDIEEAQNEVFVSCKKGHGIRATQDAIFLSKGLAPKVAFEIDNIEVCKNTVAYSRTVMLCPDDYADLNGVYFYNVYPLKNVDIYRNFFVCYKKGIYLTGYMKRFLEIVHQLPAHHALDEKLFVDL